MEEDIQRLKIEIAQYDEEAKKYKKYKNNTPSDDVEAQALSKKRFTDLKKLKEDLEIEEKKEEEEQSSGSEQEASNVEYWKNKISNFVSSQGGKVKYEESCLFRAQENMRQLELSKQAEIKKITDKYDALFDEQYRAVQTVESRLAQSRDKLHTGTSSLEKSLKHAERKNKAIKSKKSPARIRLETKIANLEAEIAKDEEALQGYLKYTEAVRQRKNKQEALNYRLTQQARNEIYNPKPAEPPKPKVIKKYKWVTPIQSQSTAQNEYNASDSGEYYSEAVHPSSSAGQTVSDPS